MLSRARYVHKKEMKIHEVVEDSEDNDYGYVLATSGASIDGEPLSFEAN